MTYTVGGLIEAADYNGFAATTNNANVNAIWNSTYGQTALAQVSVGGTVTATQWSSLNTTVSNIALHQNTSITSRTNPVAGNTIAILSNLGTDIATCYTNRFNAYASGAQYTAWTGTSSQTGVTGHASSSWTITFTHTLQFANATAATNFWGAGGLVKLQFAKSSTGFPADASWNTLASTTAGAVWISATGASKTIANVAYTGTTVIGGTGTPAIANTTQGWAQFTTGNTIIYKQFATTYVYTNNYIQVTATANATALTTYTEWFAPARNVAGTSNEISGGTATSGITFGSAPTTVMTYFPPEQVYLTNTWGTPTVTASVSAPVY